jgi:hypothetical protein
MTGVTRRERLEREGWSMRTIQDEPRLSELKQLYEDMGFEVMILPLSPDDCGECTECFDREEGRYKTLFTRPKTNRLDEREKE